MRWALDERAERAQVLDHALDPCDRAAGAVGPLGVVVQRDDLGLEQLEEAVRLDLDAAGLVRTASADEIAQPFGPGSPGPPPVPALKHSAHQPSSTEQCSAPLSTAFIPLVPEASIGRTGVLSHTSAPCTSDRARAMS